MKMQTHIKDSMCPGCFALSIYMWTKSLSENKSHHIFTHKNNADCDCEQLSKYAKSVALMIAHSYCKCILCEAFVNCELESSPELVGNIIELGDTISNNCKDMPLKMKN